MVSSLRLLPLAALLSLAGCATSPDKPYVFYQTRVAGISAAAGPGAGGADLTVGYRRRDVVLIPSGAATGEAPKEAPSVIAQFEPNSPQGHGGMGKFFASGKAAEQLAAALAKEGARPPVNVAGAGAKPAKPEKWAKAR